LGIWLSFPDANGKPCGVLRRSDLLKMSVLIEHFAAATAALDGRATGGRRYGRGIVE
jgi:hypothetical protein